MSNIIKGLFEARNDWDSNMPGYQGDYGGADNWDSGKRAFKRQEANQEWEREQAYARQREAQLAQYAQSGKFWLKLKDTQRHLPSGPFTGKQAANAAAIELLKQQPELKGNLVITAYGPDEKQGMAEGRATYGPITANHDAASKKAFAAGVRDGKAGAEKNKKYMSSALMKTTYLNGYKQGKQGVEAGLRQDSKTEEDIFINGKKVGKITKITTKSGSILYIAEVGNSSISGGDTRQQALRDLKRLIAWKNEEGVAEGWKEKVGAAAMAGAMATGAHGVVLNPARIIGPQGQTVADPYKKQTKPESKPEDDAWTKIEKRKAAEKKGVAEGSRIKTPSGMYRDQHTGVAYSKPTGQDGHDSYMTPAYMLDQYKKRLAQIAAGPHKRTKEVAQLQSRIAKLEKQGVAEGPGFDKWADDRAASQLHKLKPGMVQDRKTGKWYDPNKEFDKKMNSPEVMAQMKRMAQKEGVAEDQLDELSPQTLASYKKKAGADATAADKRGDYARGNKRFSGIMKATKKEFDNDAKGIEEENQRLDPSCWDGYKKQGTKMKGDTRVNNCVPVKESSIMKGIKK